MPKAKPDVIYVHRIEAGSWERENILKPIQEIGDTVKIIRTASIVAIGGATVGAVGVAWYLGKKWLGIAETVADIIDYTSYQSGPIGWVSKSINSIEKALTGDTGGGKSW